MSVGKHNNSWTPLHVRIHRLLKTRKLLHPNQSLLVAVSGGQDSLCLIKLLLDLGSKWNWHLAIAHCNHLWREDATGNARYVAQLAQTWGIPCYIVTAEAVMDSEAKAREWRYKALRMLAQEHHYPTIVTGHTASDRAETLLYNLMRGSGADGLQALVWQRSLAPNLHLVRPLLTVTRAETAKFCQDFQLQIWQDSTNQDLQYARNRIRCELLPYLQVHFNPQVQQTLAQTAELLSADVDYLENRAGVLYQKVIWQGEYKSTQDAENPDNASYTTLQGVNRYLLRSEPLALQRRVLRRFLQECLPSAPQFEHIEKLMSLIEAPNRTQTDPFPGGAIAQALADWIWLIPLKKNSWNPV
ncbi:MAG: tRNA lysidine(34) synthetase TilS [Scytolyngbya sp. HA4215-MV1]|jgi:tRNA(Ile)-lysidine synthase|nr:tRNA lysidine(34) synthetase TilS [Scytolyngbya sp. HA4215-MV1]